MKQNVIHGTIYLTVAQAVFVFSGYAIHMGLARLLGPADYGVYAVVVSLVTTVNLILTSGIPQAVSRYVAHDDCDRVAIRRTAFKMQIVLSFVMFFIYFVMAGRIALVFNDPGLAHFIRVSAFMIPGYAMYSVMLGYLNGLREYKKQSLNSIYYSVFNTGLILLLVVMGYSTIGAVTGFAIAPLVGVGVGLFFMRGVKKYEASNGLMFWNSSMITKQITDFAVPIIFYSVAIHLIMVVDLFFVKTYLMNYDAGIYSAVSMISRIPFFLMGGLYGALFPAISRITANNDAENTRRYITNSVKVSLAAITPAVVIVAAFPDRLITLLYSAEYASGALTLGILIFGMGFFSLFTLFATILNGSGMPRVSLVISMFILGLDAVLNYVLVPEYHLIGAATATTAACFAAFVISGTYVYWKFGISVRS